MKLTSSNFAAAIGISPWCSRQKLYRQMTGEQERDPMNEFMQWGIDHECDAVAGVELMTGIFFENTGESQVHYVETIDGMELGTTPDGSCWSKQRGRTGLEVKCPQKLPDEVPTHYIPQIIGQAMIADFEAVYFSAWTPSEQRVWYYEYQPEHGDWMKPLLAKFLQSVADGEQPKRAKKPVLPKINFERLTWSDHD